MTAPTISLTESQTLTALRSFLLSILPTGIEVIKGQQNRVAEPTSADFVVMTPTLRDRLETNTDSYSDGYPSNPSVKNVLSPAKVTVQLDVHGPGSSDNAAVITSLFRDEYATTAFSASGFDVTPLYADEGRQMPYVNGEQQVETRWVIDVALQCNPVITVPQDFASQLHVGLVNVDATYPL